MRRIAFVIVLCLVGCSRKEDQRPVRMDPQPAVAPPPSTEAAPLKPVALVELFTSEGCSSCPPADENLTRIAYAARDENKAVIALSFHVDYWNYIGWKDPFSDAKYSERQRRYARQLGSGVYTPQMVVGGREQLLGSRDGAADAAIDRALAQRPTHGIRLRLQSDDTIGFDVSGPAREVVVQIAVAQGAGGVRVKTGENAGRTLSHVNIVRALGSTRLRAPGSGAFPLSPPAAVDRSAAMVVAWAEDPATGHVLGASAQSGLLASAGP